MLCLLALQVLLCSWRVVLSFCPSQCTCVSHGMRTVLCNDPDTSEIPINVPLDTVKLRVEKTAVRRIKPEAFYYLTELRYLWLTYNSINSVDSGSFYNLKVLHELRLDGNEISMFPWEALKEMPNLKILDLHNNRLTSVPAEAAAQLMNLTYLDISSNKLNTLPSDLLDIWSSFPSIILNSQKIILGLQDNLWYCDCKISKLLEITKTEEEIPVVLMDPLVSCSGPENLAGVLFKRAELNQCVKPVVMTSATKITSPLGSNVLLRCDATGYPTPTLLWSKKDGSALSNAVVQESPGEGVRWSILSLNSVTLNDATVYHCKAKNFAGNAEASITLSVVGKDLTTQSPPFSVTNKPNEDLGLDSQTFFSTKTVLPLVSVTTTETLKQAFTTMPTTSTKIRQNPSEDIQSSPPADDLISKGAKISKTLVSKNKTNKKSRPSVRDIRVTEESGGTAVVLWTNDGFPSDSLLLIVYFPSDAEELKETIETMVGNSKLLLEDLFPNQIYTVCLVVNSEKEQCVKFNTLDMTLGEGQSRWLMIMSGVACVFVLPLIVILLYKISLLYCKSGSRDNAQPEELFKETYVKFETLPMRHRTLNGAPNDLWTRRQTQESERMLLCSRSSIDSQMTYKSDSSRSEYLC